jgi:glycosyltransferase involved in cell wall biosynthesis
MHQYTANLANRMIEAGHEVVLVTSALLPRDRYAPTVDILTPIATSNTGFSWEGLNFRQQELIAKTVANAAPDVLHFSGPHLWNINLVRRFRRLGYPVIHTIHDLDPHSGMRMGSLLTIWNRLIIREADHILVHGQLYRQRMLQRGVPAEKVTYTPLLHLFVGHKREKDLNEAVSGGAQVSYESFALFFGRLAKYKGIDHLLAAFAQLASQGPAGCKLVLAGSGDLSPLWTGDLPANTILYNRLIGDEEAVDLFSRCSLVVLPYTDATQSALIAAAYFFKKPAIVSRSGALAESVMEGKTGFIVEPGHPSSLARKLSVAFRSPESLREMGQAGRAWYDRNRTKEIEAFKNLYSALMERSERVSIIR